MRGPLVTTLCLVGLELASQRDLEIPPAAIVLMLLAVAASILGALLATRDEVRMRMPRMRWR